MARAKSSKQQTGAAAETPRPPARSSLAVSPQSTSDRRSLVIAVVLAAVTFLLFGPAKNFEFINYDDPEYVLDNPLVRRGFSTDGIKWAFTSIHAHNWHPLTTLSHMLDCGRFGVNAGPAHLVSVAWHAAAAVLLFLALGRMTKAVWPSAFVAALFAWHPLHVESVAWISERKDVLSGFFWMLTLLAYARYVERPGAGRYAAVAGSLLLGLLCKPMLVTLPFVLLLLDIWPLKRWSLEGPFKIPGTLIKEKLPLLALVVASSVVTFLVQRSSGAVASQVEHSLPARFANAVVSYVRYLIKMVWPADLAIYYPMPANWPLAVVAGAAAVLIVVTAMALTKARRHPHWLVGWLWYLGTLVPVIGIVQVGSQAMADRYTYIPLLGIFMAVAWSLKEAVERHPKFGLPVNVAAAVVVAACIPVTASQLGRWQNSGTVFEHAAAVTKDNIVAHMSAATYLVDQNNTEAALKHFTEASRINPNNVLLQVNLGTLYSRMGNAELAKKHTGEALKLNLNSPDARKNMGKIFVGERNWAEAAVHLREAARLIPLDADVRLNLGNALNAQGLVDEAMVHYAEAVRLQPNSPVVLNNLGYLLAQKGQVKEAADHYRRAIGLKPDYFHAVNNLARLLAASPKAEVRNGPEALQLAQQACAATGNKNADLLDTLAIALAECGRFPEAVQAAQRALEMARASGNQFLTDALPARIQLFQSNMPYREN